MKVLQCRFSTFSTGDESLPGWTQYSASYVSAPGVAADRMQKGSGRVGVVEAHLTEKCRLRDSVSVVGVFGPRGLTSKLSLP